MAGIAAGAVVPSKIVFQRGKSLVPLGQRRERL